MTCTYRTRIDTVYDEDGNAYTVYGIEAVGAGGEILASIPDVFFDRQKAEHLADLCNEGHLSLLHLRDVVEDALVG